MSSSLSGQNDSVDSCNCDYDKEFIFGGPEKIASFPGGDEAPMKFLSDNLAYPEEAKNKFIKDIVYVRFCILSNGEIKEKTKRKRNKNAR